MPIKLNLCFTNIKLSSCPQLPPLQPSHNPLLIKNFNSLYEGSSAISDHSTLEDSDSDNAHAPDLSTVLASNRFFFSSPGSSNSIIDSSTSSLASTSSSAYSDSTHIENNTNVEGSIAVQTYSPDPYTDFRQSMQEMVEARELHDIRENWDYLHELLMRYISLNPKNTHKFIVGAFADLVVSLMTSLPEKGQNTT